MFYMEAMYSPGTCVLGKRQSEQVASHVRQVDWALKSLSSSRPPPRLTLEAPEEAALQVERKPEGNRPQLIEDADSGVKAPRRDIFSPVW